MNDSHPVVEIRGRFADEVTAAQAADALQRWIRWILDGSPEPIPPVFEGLGVNTAEFAWTLDTDVDWEIGPHAKVEGAEVRLLLETHDTHLRLAGLLRSLGARGVQVRRDTP